MYFGVGRRKRPVSTGFLFLCEGIVLAFGIYFGVQWQLAQAEANNYYAASVCTSEKTTGCTTEKVVSVVSTRSSRFNKANHYYVTVLVPNTSDETQVQVGEGYATWAALTPGTPLTAIYWDGKLVALRGSVPPVIRTTDHPGWRASDQKRNTEIAWAIAVGIAILLVLKLMGYGSTPTPKAPRRSSSLDSFQFSHVDDSRGV